jgi:hypothetical protein
MPLIGESSWDAYPAKKNSNTQYTLSTHDWPPAARYLKIQCLTPWPAVLIAAFFPEAELTFKDIRAGFLARILIKI